MKIAIFDVEPKAKKYLAQRFSKDSSNECLSFGSPVTEELVEKIKDYEIISVFVSSKLTAELMRKMPKLKLIVCRSTGFDNVDVDYAKSANITVCNVPSYGENTVAEHAFMLLLAVARKLMPSVEQIKNGEIDHTKLVGLDLAKKTLGVVGTGKIGKHAITIGRGFDMQVLGFDPFPDESLKNLAGFNYVNFDQLLEASDFITIHAPLTDQNEHLFNDEALSKMKKGAILINTSRGEIVDTKALVEVLSSGHLAGAGLDVIELENLLETDDEISLLANPSSKKSLSMLAEQAILEKMDNVILTPHNAFNTEEAVARIWTTTLENIDKFIENNPQNVIKT